MITHIRLTKNGDQYAVCCVHDGFRYHYWTDDRATLKPMNDILYKSPPQGTSRLDKEWFNPRKLKIRKHTQLVESLRSSAIDLLPATEQADAEMEAGRLELQRLRSRSYLMSTVRNYAMWDLKTPLDKVGDDALLTALEILIKRLALPPSIYD